MEVIILGVTLGTAEGWDLQGTSPFEITFIRFVPCEAAKGPLSEAGWYCSSPGEEPDLIVDLAKPNLELVFSPDHSVEVALVPLLIHLGALEVSLVPLLVQLGAL